MLQASNLQTHPADQGGSQTNPGCQNQSARLAVSLAHGARRVARRGKPRICTLEQLHARCTSNANGCILYPPTQHRYGIVQTATVRTTAQRAALILSGVAIPPGAYVCHKCDNPRCCNPDHLFIGTQADNIKDMWRKNRANPNGIKSRVENWDSRQFAS